MKNNAIPIITLRLRLNITVVMKRNVRIVIINDTVRAPDRRAIVLTPEIVKIFCERNNEYSPIAYITVRAKSAIILLGISGENTPNPMVKRNGRINTCGEK